MINCELLSPAGSFDSLKAAVELGANAVYLGGSLFNARASATNFNQQELEDAVDYCHLRKVKVYVTVNILISDREFKDLEKFIKHIYSIGVDGVIVQDIGVAMYIKKIAPNLPLHASTQMTVYDLEGALFLKELGFKRVVLARELPLDKIKYISKNSGIETEIFVHGAMCVSYSGQCLMSSVIGGRSGNRGKCAQPCRLQYEISDKKGTLMSLKDMCLIKHLKDIEDAGVTSLKIEGRMKGPSYVGTVVSTYRKYLDTEDSVTDKDYNALESIFYRGGFSDGYLKGKKGSKMFCHQKPENPYLKQEFDTNLQTSFTKTKVYFYLTAKTGESLKLNACDEFGNVSDYSSSFIIEKATKSNLNTDKIKENLSKLGNTVFDAENIELDVDDDAFIPTSEINKARRFVTSELESAIINSYKRQFTSNELKSVKLFDKISDFNLSVFVSDKSQLNAIKSLNCKRIIAPIEIHDSFSGDEIVALPRISPDNLEKVLSTIKNTDVLVRNIGQINIAKRCNKNIHIDYTMNVFNAESIDFYSEHCVKSVTLSTELTLSQIRDLCSNVPLESVIYGKLPLMITENCLIKSTVGCKHGGFIKDRTNEKFYIRCLPDCRNEILNSKPIMMSDKIDDILKSNISFGRLDFTTESPEECIKIYNSYKNGMPLNTEFTRGKFYKGV